MEKRKTILAIGTILLFFGLALHPTSAFFTKQESKSLYTITNEDGTLTNYQCADEKAEQIDTQLARLFTRVQAAGSYAELMNVLTTSLREFGRYPFMVLILSLMIKGIQLTSNINQLRPLRKNAFIISWGFTNKLNPFKDNKIQLYRPLTMWYYSGRSNLVINSRTIILDLYPFSIKSLTGRQVGFMRNFAGLYIHRQTTLGDKSWSLMLGRSACVRGFDLSIFNVWNQ